MIRGDLENPSTNETAVVTCPCLGHVDGIPVCLNNDEIVEVDLVNLHPTLLSQVHRTPIESTMGKLPICFGCVLTGRDRFVRCGTTGQRIRIHNRVVKVVEIEEALEAFPKDMFTSIEEICSECLYKVLTSLIWNDK